MNRTDLFPVDTPPLARAGIALDVTMLHPAILSTTPSVIASGLLNARYESRFGSFIKSSIPFGDVYNTKLVVSRPCSLIILFAARTPVNDNVPPDAIPASAVIAAPVFPLTHLPVLAPPPMAFRFEPSPAFPLSVLYATLTTCLDSSLTDSNANALLFAAARLLR